MIKRGGGGGVLIDKGCYPTYTMSTAIVLNSESQACIHKNLFIQLNIKHATCKIYKIKCLKVANINGQKK